MADTVPTKESAVLVDQTDLNMTSIQLSVTVLVLILVAMGNSQMGNDTSMAMMDVSLTTEIDAVPTTGIVAPPMTGNVAPPMTGNVASPTIMSNASPMTGIVASSTTVTDSASMAGPEPTPGPEAGAEGGPLLLPEWAIAFIVVGGVFLVLATIAVVGMCVRIATKSR